MPSIPALPARSSPPVPTFEEPCPSGLDLDKPADRMLACLGMPDLTPTEAKVLAAIAYRDGAGGAWPSDDWIAKVANLPDRPAAQKVRKALRGKGRLFWTRGQHTNRYTIYYLHCGKFSHTAHSANQASTVGISPAQCGDFAHSTVGNSPTRTGLNRTKSKQDIEPDVAREVAAASEGAATRAQGNPIPPEYRAKLVEMGMLKPQHTGNDDDE